MVITRDWRAQELGEVRRGKGGWRCGEVWRDGGGGACASQRTRNFGYTVNESWTPCTRGLAASNAALCDLNFTKRIVLMVSVLITKQQQ